MDSTNMAAIAYMFVKHSKAEGECIVRWWGPARWRIIAGGCSAAAAAAAANLLLHQHQLLLLVVVVGPGPHPASSHPPASKQGDDGHHHDGKLHHAYMYSISKLPKIYWHIEFWIGLFTGHILTLYWHPQPSWGIRELYDYYRIYSNRLLYNIHINDHQPRRGIRELHDYR